MHKGKLNIDAARNFNDLLDKLARRLTSKLSVGPWATDRIVAYPRSYRDLSKRDSREHHTIRVYREKHENGVERTRLVAQNYSITSLSNINAEHLQALEDLCLKELDF